jgi:hypothetical protein
VHASIDLVTYKVRLDGSKWLLSDYDGPELFNAVRAWLEAKQLPVSLELPEFAASPGQFDSIQADQYAEALWWFNHQLRQIKAGVSGGLTSPVLLYPHHFDLSLVWYPEANEHQYVLGFSIGDDIVPVPYVYLTAYPNADELKHRPLPAGAYWQSDGFKGAVLPYAALQVAKQPEKLMRDFSSIFAAA